VAGTVFTTHRPIGLVGEADSSTSTTCALFAGVPSSTVQRPVGGVVAVATACVTGLGLLSAKKVTHGGSPKAAQTAVTTAVG
jgi:hypothetical protein